MKKNAPRLQAALSIALSLSVWLELLPLVKSYFPIIWLIQIFMIFGIHTLRVRKSVYYISLILLIASNLANGLIMLFNYLSLQKALSGGEYQNVIASENFGRTVMVMLLPVVYRVFLTASAIITIIVILESIASIILKKHKEKKQTMG